VALEVVLYLRSDADVPLPPYIGRFFEEAPARWGYGPVAGDKEKVNTLLQVVKCLVNEDVTGPGSSPRSMRGGCCR
jgi:hypothetical protein